MPFTEDNLREMLLRLQGDAGACRELQNLIRDPAIEGVRSEVAGLGDAQRRTGERLAELAAAQTRTEERLAELSAAQARTEAALAELSAAQAHTEARLAALIDHVDLLTDRVSGLVGESMERRYRERAGAYFGAVLRRTRVLDSLALADALEERLTPD